MHWNVTELVNPEGKLWKWRLCGVNDLHVCLPLRDLNVTFLSPDTEA